MTGLPVLLGHESVRRAKIHVPAAYSKQGHQRAKQISRPAVQQLPWLRAPLVVSGYW
jgi:hypothetical protein